MARAFDVVTADGPRAHCAGPEHLPLVDAAFAKPGGPAAQQMKATLCPGCPIGAACLAWAMSQREEGIWGGTGPNLRTRKGAPGSGHAVPVGNNLARRRPHNRTA